MDNKKLAEQFEKSLIKNNLIESISAVAAMFSLPWVTAPMFFPVASPGGAKKSRFSGVARAKREAKKRRNRRG